MDVGLPSLYAFIKKNVSLLFSYRNYLGIVHLDAKQLV